MDTPNMNAAVADEIAEEIAERAVADEIAERDAERKAAEEAERAAERKAAEEEGVPVPVRSGEIIHIKGHAYRVAMVDGPALVLRHTGFIIGRRVRRRGRRKAGK